MKKIAIVTFLLLNLCLLTGCSQKEQGPVNNSTWSECGSSFACLADNAGFSFKLDLSNFEARATKGLAEVTFPFINDNNVTIRKSLKISDDDISGVTTKFLVEKEVTVADLPVKVKGNGSVFYVANLNTEKAHYSIYCKTGMTTADIEKVINLIFGSESR